VKTSVVLCGIKKRINHRETQNSRGNKNDILESSKNYKAKINHHLPHEYSWALLLVGGETFISLLH